jgi:hypothetical protein
MSKPKIAAAKKTATLLDARAEVLLQAQVAFVVEALHEPQLDHWLDYALDVLLADAAKLKLKDVVSAALVKETVRVFAVELDLRGGIPELIAGIGRAVYAHPILRKTTLADVISDQEVAQFTDKILELRSAREDLLRGVLSNPLFTSFASDLIYQGVKDYLAHSNPVAGIPGASSVFKLGKAVASRAGARLEGAVEEGIRKTISKTVQATAARSAEALIETLDAATLRTLVMDIWREIKAQPLSMAHHYLPAADFEELLVMGYEYWGELRQQAIYVTLINAGVEAFFARYGEFTLAALLDELGVTRALMAAEARRYLVPVTKGLAKKKLLEPMLRQALEPFYASEKFKAALQSL